MPPGATMKMYTGGAPTVGTKPNDGGGNKKARGKSANDQSKTSRVRAKSKLPLWLRIVGWVTVSGLALMAIGAPRSR